MPIGILGSLVICLLYVLFAYVLTGLENYLNFKGDASPVTTAFAKQVTHFKFWTYNYCRIHCVM
jgi:hypothetical protein